MKRPRSRMHVLPSERLDRPVFRTGVSLHSHTMHSKEQLKDLPQYLERMPVVAQFLESGLVDGAQQLYGAISHRVE